MTPRIITITGVEEVDRKLQRIDKKTAKRVGRRAVNKGNTVVRKRLRAAVRVTGRSKAAKAQRPVADLLKRSIGSRNKRNRKANFQEAKTGVNVGKKKAAQVQHAHLFTLGTQDRYVGRRRSLVSRFVRKLTGSRRGYRGRLRSNDFVSRTAPSALAEAKRVMIQTVEEGLAKEVPSA